MHIFAYHVFYSFLVFQGFFFYQFLCVQRIFFSHSFRVSLLVTHSLSFPLSADVLFFLSFLKDISTGYSGFRVLFFQHLKKLCHFFLVFMVSDEKPTAFELGSPPGKVSLLSHYFQEFSLSSVFGILTIMCLGVSFFRFILFGIHSTT